MRYKKPAQAPRKPQRLPPSFPIPYHAG